MIYRSTEWDCSQAVLGKTMESVQTKDSDRIRLGKRSDEFESNLQLKCELDNSKWQRAHLRANWSCES